MLERYDGKYVEVELTDGRVFRGYVGDYVEPADNENGEESIILDIKGWRYPVELAANEIRKVKIIEP